MAEFSFALPVYDLGISRLYAELCTGLHMLDDLLSLFPPKEITHRGQTRQVSSPQLLDTRMRLHQATVSAEPDMFYRTDATRFSEFVVSLIMALQVQQKSHVLEVISETSDATGNNIDGKDRNLWDVYIEALEKVEFGFDHNGKPLCNFYLPSELATKTTTVVPTEEQLKRASEIVNNKREKYFANKRYRRLHLTVTDS